MRFRHEFAFLSNFHPAQVMYGGRVYPTTEHAYQAAKTLDDAERLRIAKAPSPGHAKRMGRTVKVTEDWEERKLAVMEALLREKFKIPQLRKLLVSTYPQKIVEDNTWGDRFWGVYEGRGENHLGKLLMKIRLEIVEHDRRAG